MHLELWIIRIRTSVQAALNYRRESSGCMFVGGDDLMTSIIIGFNKRRLT